MTKKPSLYVVERKEVIILIILFILVTILAFTVGVKYGEIVGRRNALEKNEAESVLAESSAVAGGHLSPGEKTAAAGETPDNHGAAGAEKTAAESGKTPVPGEKPAEAAKAEEKPAAVIATEGKGEALPPNPPPEKKTSPDTDEYLLDALKEAGIERGQGKAVKPEKPAANQENLDEEAARPEAKPEVNDEADSAEPLPSKLKGKSKGEPKSDAFWSIQVASYPTEQEAKRHSDRLRAHNLNPMVFSGLDSNKGKWYRVILGKYSDRDKAMQSAKSYKAKGQIEEGAFVRKIP